MVKHSKTDMIASLYQQPVGSSESPSLSHDVHTMRIFFDIVVTTGAVWKRSAGNEYVSRLDSDLLCLNTVVSNSNEEVAIPYYLNGLTHEARGKYSVRQ